MAQKCTVGKSFRKYVTVVIERKKVKKMAEVDSCD
jgi:hypothetical protein